MRQANALAKQKKAAIIKRKNVRLKKMGLIGLGLSIGAGFFMLIGLVPFLGWLNWITTLPLAFAAAVVSGLGIAKNRSLFGAAGLIIAVIVFFIGSGRLFVGCGII
jgi:hypothetical protein